MNAVASPHSLRARQRLYLSFWILGEEFEPGFDRGLAVRHALATEEGPPDAAGNAVVVARDRDVHHVTATSTSCRLGIVIAGAPAGFGCTERPYPNAPAAGRQGLRLSFAGLLCRSSLPVFASALPAPHPTVQPIILLLYLPA